MNSKIRIKGLGNIVLIGEKIEPEKEYLISIRAELRKIEKDITDKDDPIYTYIMEYLNTELVQQVGDSKKLKVEHGKTKSQKLRWAIENEGVYLGLDDYYNKEMDRLIAERMEKIKD